jgi:hypothetical protein
VTSFGIPTAVLEQARRVADEITAGIGVAVDADEIITGRAAIESLERGGGELIELSMAAVAATYAALPDAPFENLCATPHPSAHAASLGADNALVNRLVAERLYAAC